MRPERSFESLGGLFFAALPDARTACRHIAVVGNFPPTRCGIATFTADMVSSLRAAEPDTKIDVYAMVSDASAECPENVCSLIDDSDRAAHRKAGIALDRSGADLIWLQHEFGIFGGNAGEWVIDMLTMVAAPLVVTFHTVLAHPTPAQLRVMNWLNGRAARMVVMSNEGAQILQHTYHVAPERISVIAHGVPDRPFGRTQAMKAAFGITGRKVMMTFGLLSPNKGLETVISALPAIVARHPDVLYCIVGETHSKLIAHEGEAYRQRLMELGENLGVEGNIRWINRYLPTDELLDLIEAADIYMTPYTNSEQSTSGTLSYAVALGKAVVSTPYKHAAELLDDGLGVLVPFDDSAAVSLAVNDLFSQPVALTTMQRRAYAAGRSMTWRVFGQKSMEIVDEVSAPSIMPAPARTISESGLFRLCDHTGITQHGVLSVPDRSHGYCIDDNARALMLAASSPTPFASLAPVFAAFVQHGWNPDSNCFRNFMSYDRRWLEDMGSEDSCARTLWCLGVVACEAHDPGLRAWAEKLWNHTAKTGLDFQSPRAVAFAILGADAMLNVQPADSVAIGIIHRGFDILSRLHGAHRRDNWNWFEPILAYDNCRLVEAFLKAAVRLENNAAIRNSLDVLAWIIAKQTAPSGHFRPIGSNAFGITELPDDPFDQQAVDAWATVDAAVAAYRLDGSDRWADAAKMAFAWFFGQNDRNLAVVDVADGSCRDGLTPQGLNLNQGAESVLSVHLAQRSMRQLKAKGVNTNVATDARERTPLV